MVLNPVISKLTGKLVVLASASPRRLEILTNVGLRFEVVPSWFKETLDKRLFKTPQGYAVETAKQKALEVARRMPFKHLKTPDIVIAADTVVTVDGLILEKPVDKQDAYRMLSRLSGKEHSVFTGVVIVLCHEKEDEETEYQVIDFYEETKVKFAELSEDMLWEYINSGEPMDKAGGYGIQALGGMLVEYVHGDFLNVVGFPLNHFCKQLCYLFNSHPTTLCLSSPVASLTNNSTQTSPTASCANNSPPASPTSSCPPANLAHHTASASPTYTNPPANLAHHVPPASPAHNSPSASHAHKVKGDAIESEEGDGSWTLVNSLSKCVENGDGEARDIRNTAVLEATSRGVMHMRNVEEHDDSESEDSKEDLRKIIELMDGFKASKALFAASKLRLFDVLMSRPGLEAVEVAQEIQTSVKGTKRLLEACVSLGLLESQESMHQTTMYQNTDLARRFLLSDAPLSLQGYIQHCNELVWPLFTHLESAVKEGTNQHERAFGKKSGDLFHDAYYSRHEVKLRFMNAMHSIAKVTGRVVATTFDLSGYKTACDLGGCTGAIAYEFARAYPELSVTVLDLPAVIEMSGHFRPHNAEDRVSFVAGDFFKDKLPKADMYILARILHDWSDEKVHALLSKISDACVPGCAVVLAETMSDGPTPYPSLQSLNMLVQTEGKERPKNCYRDLLIKYGFGEIRMSLTRNFLDVVIGIKK